MKTAFKHSSASFHEAGYNEVQAGRSRRPSSFKLECWVNKKRKKVTSTKKCEQPCSGKYDGGAAGRRERRDHIGDQRRLSESFNLVHISQISHWGKPHQIAADKIRATHKTPSAAWMSVQRPSGWCFTLKPPFTDTISSDNLQKDCIIYGNGFLSRKICVLSLTLQW